jgi:hypothetical protein
MACSASALALYGAIACRGGQPTRRGCAGRRHAASALAPGDGVLRALLGKFPVPGHPDESGDDPSPFLPVGIRDGDLDVLYRQNGLTSILPNSATGCLDATSMASSRFAHSMMSNPAMASLASRTVRRRAAPHRRAPAPSSPRSAGAAGHHPAGSRARSSRPAMGSCRSPFRRQHPRVGRRCPATPPRTGHLRF